MKICIFYHCLFFGGNSPVELPAALGIVSKQMGALEASGLLDAAHEFHVGINGGVESITAASFFIPKKAWLSFHGREIRNENLTLAQLEKWLPGHEDWYVLYFHAKGASHPPGHDMSTRWRDCMMKHLVWNWQKCVADLDAGYEAVGCHWMEPPTTPPKQYIFGGNFWWAKASFLATLPSIWDRERIKMSGIGALESRYEAEVWIGNGWRPPHVKDYHGPNWTVSQVGSCPA